MTCLLYLTYKINYAIDTDRLFLNWVQCFGRKLGVTHIVVVDNFDVRRTGSTFALRDINVRVIGGNNREREFAGYLSGLRILPECQRYVLLNDTFMQTKHAPYTLLGPAIAASLEKVEEAATVYGEINNAPASASYGDVTGVTWISSYCFVFGHEAREAFTVAIETVTNEFFDLKSNLNEDFILHINRQMRGRPGCDSDSWMSAKYCATASEIQLSQLLRDADVKLCSVYSINVSPIIFARNTLRRLVRKWKYNLSTRK